VVEIADRAAVGRASLDDAAGLRPLTAVPLSQWRRLSECVIEPNGYYLPSWEMAVDAFASGRTGAFALLARSDAAPGDAGRLIGLLPKLIRVDTWQSPEMEWIQSTLRFIAAEAQQLNAGGETVITRLADILVIQAVRAWIAHAPAAQTGWLGALRDRQIGRAIAMIHRDPACNWTVATLAGRVGMSRSAFSARFTQLVGESAMRYAVRWKMQAALAQLQETDASLTELATRLGYDSDAAFSRAFKRIVGVSPGAARRNGRVQIDDTALPLDG